MLDNHSAVDRDLLLIALFLEGLSRHASQYLAAAFNFVRVTCSFALLCRAFTTIEPFTQHAPSNSCDDSIRVMAPEKQQAALPLTLKTAASARRT